VGPKSKARTFWVHPERRAVHNVGDVRLVFSTNEQPQPGRAVQVQKVLMTDAVTLAAEAVVRLYDLRWQIEISQSDYRSRGCLYLGGWAA
jgi:hypothetical protein